MASLDQRQCKASANGHEGNSSHASGLSETCSSSMANSPNTTTTFSQSPCAHSLTTPSPCVHSLITEDIVSDPARFGAKIVDDFKMALFRRQTDGPTHLYRELTEGEEHGVDLCFAGEIKKQNSNMTLLLERWKL